MGEVNSLNANQARIVSEANRIKLIEAQLVMINAMIRTYSNKGEFNVSIPEVYKENLIALKERGYKIHTYIENKDIMTQISW